MDNKKHTYKKVEDLKGKTDMPFDLFEQIYMAIENIKKQGGVS